VTKLAKAAGFIMAERLVNQSSMQRKFGSNE
jgi:hypothetical protein